MNETDLFSEHFNQRLSKDITALEKNVNDYPYSALANFLLLFHYKKTSNANLETHAKKTALHFNNQHWLNFVLTNNSGTEKQSIISLPENIEDKDANIAVEKEAEVVIPEIIQNEKPEEISSVQNLLEEKDASGEIITDKKFEEEISQKEVINGEDVSPTIDGQNVQSEIPAEIIPEKVAEDFTESENEISDQPQNIEQPEEANFISSSIKAKIENTLYDKETIAFDPLHTIDYFASQGIKITEDLAAKDKLGSQVKSFTEWLKSMKKLHAGKLAEQNVAVERLVQSAAEESNINTEVLTEAMAEVLIKQDKKEKAIEMYSKLSLINPSKSAYFASKIESIKSS